MGTPLWRWGAIVFGTSTFALSALYISVLLHQFPKPFSQLLEFRYCKFLNERYVYESCTYSGLVLGQAAPESDPELQRLPYWLYICTVGLFEGAFKGFPGLSTVW